MNPETPRRDLVEADVRGQNIHADINVPLTVDVATLNVWMSVGASLEHGDVLLVVAL